MIARLSDPYQLERGSYNGAKTFSITASSVTTFRIVIMNILINITVLSIMTRDADCRLC